MKAAFNSVAPFWWCQQRLLNGPPVSHSPTQQCLIEAVNLGPFRDAPTLPLKLNKHVALQISLLSFNISPTAILRRVTGVPVNAVNGAAVGPLPHIAQKVFKMQPPVAYGYANCAVARVLAVAFAGAAPNHVYPGVVGCRKHSAKRVAVRKSVIAPTARYAAVNATSYSARAGSDFKGCSANRASSSFFHAKILHRNKFKGQPLRGLTIRRQAEYQKCTGAAQ